MVFQAKNSSYLLLRFPPKKAFILISSKIKMNAQIALSCFFIRQFISIDACASTSAISLK